MKTPIILVMGLQGSGKTTLAKPLCNAVANQGAWCQLLNSTFVRAVTEDWDFTDAGRATSARRLRNWAESFRLQGMPTIIDMICPTNKLREIIDADIIVWINTITKSDSPAIDAIFEPPANADYVLQSYDQSEAIIKSIASMIRS